MNIAKLVRRNLRLPMAQRVSSNVITAQVASGVAIMRGNVFALMARIHAEIEPKILAMRNAEIALSREQRNEE